MRGAREDRASCCRIRLGRCPREARRSSMVEVLDRPRWVGGPTEAWARKGREKRRTVRGEGVQAGEEVGPWEGAAERAGRRAGRLRLRRTGSGSSRSESACTEVRPGTLNRRGSALTGPAAGSRGSWPGRTDPPEPPEFRTATWRSGAVRLPALGSRRPSAERMRRSMRRTGRRSLRLCWGRWPAPEAERGTATRQREAAPLLRRSRSLDTEDVLP